MNESGNMKIKEIQNDGQQKWQKNNFALSQELSWIERLATDQKAGSSNLLAHAEEI